MKKYFTLLATTGLLFISGLTYGQNTNKEVILEEVNGVKTLTVTKVVEGKKSTQTYTGAQAEAEIKKMENKGGGVTMTEYVADDGRLLIRIEPKKTNTSTK